ncbi:MAG: MFS transporter [Candidatus Thermoplasmatota archaeon]|nr:MFS transporter [Candidatus Thermoplasmatota archaeon]
MGAGDDRIRRYYFFRAVTSFSLWLPFWLLWVYENFENMLIVTVIDTAFWATMILFQIPTGLIGDKYGRKTVLFIGEVTYVAGIFLFGMSDGFWQFLGSNMVWALGVCFIVSGDTPFLYDTLIELKREKEFINIMARCNALMYAMNAVACVVGGMIVDATDRLDLTLLIAAGIGLFGSMTIVFLKEPLVTTAKVQGYQSQLRVGMKIVFGSGAILVLVLFQVVIEIAVYVMAVFRPVYMSSDLSLSYLDIGLFYASFSVVNGIVLTQAGRIETYLGEKMSLFTLYASTLISFVVVFLIVSPVAILAQYLMYAVSGLLSPITYGYINKRVLSSQHRSTVIAIATFLFTLLLAAVEIPAGYSAQESSLRETLLLLAIVIAPIGAYLLHRWAKEVDRIPGTAPGLIKTRVLKKF